MREDWAGRSQSHSSLYAITLKDISYFFRVAVDSMSSNRSYLGTAGHLEGEPLLGDACTLIRAVHVGRWGCLLSMHEGSTITAGIGIKV